MKTVVKKAFNVLGYDIHKTGYRKPDIGPYLDIFGEDNVKKRRFYNIGAGGFRHPCWTNVDNPSDWYREWTSDTGKGILHNLFSLEPLPIESNSAQIVYSSHTVEHITDEAAHNLYAESYRILKYGGFLRLTTPDIDLDYRAYKDNDRRFFYWADTENIPKITQKTKYKIPLNEASIEQLFLEHFATSVSTLHSDGADERISDDELNRIFTEMEYASALNYCTSRCPIEIQRKYPGNHINWWNKDKMFRMLKKAGFNKIHLSGYGQSFSPILRDTIFFDNTHPKISLYVEAIK